MANNIVTKNEDGTFNVEINFSRVTEKGMLEIGEKIKTAKQSFDEIENSGSEMRIYYYSPESHATTL